MRYRLGIYMIIVSLLQSCTPDEEDLYKFKKICSVTDDINTFTFWNNSNIYIIQKENFKVNAQLIIQKGTIIKLDPAFGRSIFVTDSGHIAAQGTQYYPVIFTSFYDDTNGGDSNGDGIITKPSIGDWDFIYLKTQNHCYFNYTHFYFGGGNNVSSTLIIDNSSAEIRNCIFANNRGGNLTNIYGCLNAKNATSKTRIIFNTFYNNDLPVVINTLISYDNSNIYYNPKDSSQKNKFNTVIIDTKNPLQGHVIWQENKVALLISGIQLKIDENNSLTLGNKVVLKFFKNTQLWLFSGANSIKNIGGYGVKLTSIYDDSEKGDTNADGSYSNPNVEDWIVYVKDDTNALDISKIKYAKIVFLP